VSRVGISWWRLQGLILGSRCCGIDSAVAPGGDPQLENPDGSGNRDEEHAKDSG